MEQGVNGLRQMEVRPIGNQEFEGRIVLARLLHHRGRAVQANDLRTQVGDPGGEMTGSAAQIHDAFARLRIEQVDQLRPVLPDEGMLLIIQTGVPPVRGTLGI